MSKSAIEWTQQTWNPLAGCKEISPGCTNCYAALMAARLERMGQRKYAGTTTRLPNGKVVWTGKINLDEGALSIPLKTKRPTTWFVNSMSDLFHEDVPDEFIVKVFAVMLLTQQHTYQVLTKRAERMFLVMNAPNFGECVYDMAYHLSHDWTCGGLMDDVPEVDVLPNMWAGVSVEDQQRANERIPYLLRTPAAVRFLSCEPLLEPVNLDRIEIRPNGKNPTKLSNQMGDWAAPLTGAFKDSPTVQWVIVGGESGPGARPFVMDWAASIIIQCKEAGVPVFMKQVGSKPMINADLEARGIETSAWGPIKDRKGGVMSEWPEHLRVREMPKAVTASNPASNT